MSKSEIQLTKTTVHTWAMGCFILTEQSSLYNLHAKMMCSSVLVSTYLYKFEIILNQGPLTSFFWSF